MDFAALSKQFEWIPFSGQMDRNVTYLFVFNGPVARLVGESDILYIGETKQPISNRYKQETQTKNSQGNTQQTNIRTSFVFNKIGLTNVKCYYMRALTVDLKEEEWAKFLGELRTWDKKTFLKLSISAPAHAFQASLEKYLLVRYSAEHLEVPPMNNRM